MSITKQDLDDLAAIIADYCNDYQVFADMFFMDCVDIEINDLQGDPDRIFCGSPDEILLKLQSSNNGWIVENLKKKFLLKEPM